MKVEIKPKEADAFLQNLNEKHPIKISHESKSYGRHYLPKDARGNPVEWWDPDSAKEFVSAESITPGSDLISVLINLDQPDKAIVYLSYSDD
ncbi:MAG: hypothetical protein ACYC0V_06980 [Armatimonadota bacterium]